MSGLLRRFRRGKPKAEEEPEPVDVPEEPGAGDTDIYPHPAPAAPEGDDPALAPEGPVIAEEQGGEWVGPPAELPEEIGPPPAAPAEAGPLDRTELAPPLELPATPPPRLPEASAGAVRSAHRPLTAPGHCFLCGTEMSGSFCPTCRMTWNE
jgi:hypothetical protein